MDHTDIENIEHKRRLQIITIFSYFIILFLTLFTIVDILIGRYLISVILVLLLIVSAVNVVLLRRSPNFERAGNFILIPYITFTLMIFYEGGIDGTGPVWSYFVPVFAFYLKGTREGLKYAIAHGLLINVVYLLSVAGIIPRHYGALYFLIFFGSLVALSSFLMIFENMRNQYAENAKMASDKLIKANQELLLLSTRDFLTGCHNRRSINGILEQEIQRFTRYHAPLSALIADLDHFKAINDEFGHDIGDAVLKEFVRRSLTKLRITDSLGRYGGEEFLIILPDTDLSAAKVVAERVRSEVEHISVDGDTRSSTGTTVSMGVGQLKKDESPEAFIKRLDAALYRAKDLGRNRCVISG